MPLEFEEDPKRRKCIRCAYSKISFSLYYCTYRQLLVAAEETCNNWKEGDWKKADSLLEDDDDLPI